MTGGNEMASPAWLRRLEQASGRALGGNDIGENTCVTGQAVQRATNPLLWTPLVAPSLSDFEALAQESFGRLPANFRELCARLVIRIEDFPANEVLDELGAKSEFDILGLFRGTGLPYRHTADDTSNTVFLYRRPILDYWAEHPEPLGAVVMHVLVHHIANHFGLSNEDIAAIEADPS